MCAALWKAGTQPKRIKRNVSAERNRRQRSERVCGGLRSGSEREPDIGIREPHLVYYVRSDGPRPTRAEELGRPALQRVKARICARIVEEVGSQGAIVSQVAANSVSLLET